MWKPLALAVAFLLSSSLRSAYGQFYPGEKRGVSRIKIAPNPQTSQLSGKGQNTKQQAIERAIRLGNQARNGNDYYQALAHYQHAQKLNPKEARAYYGLGNLYSDLNCNNSAIEAYRKALGLKEDYVLAGC
jgi:tetratricopeptide (TPR) repeat protein